MKSFPLGDILSVTTGCLLSPRHIEGVYDILNYMTRDNLFTHQLGRASNECKPWLLRQHPQLADVTGDDITTDNFRDWLAKAVARFGDELPVEPIPRDDHEVKNPIKELVDMVGADRVIVVTEPEATQ